LTGLDQRLSAGNASGIAECPSKIAGMVGRQRDGKSLGVKLLGSNLLGSKLLDKRYRQAVR
jgi:hypothetical protein